MAVIVNQTKDIRENPSVRNNGELLVYFGHINNPQRHQDFNLNFFPIPSDANDNVNDDNNDVVGRIMRYREVIKELNQKFREFKDSINRILGELDENYKNYLNSFQMPLNINEEKKLYQDSYEALNPKSIIDYISEHAAPSNLGESPSLYDHISKNY